MKYTVMIEQIRYGYVEIEAPSDQEALEEAARRFTLNGEMLPDMEDSSPLTYSIVDEWD